MNDGMIACNPRESLQAPLLHQRAKAGFICPETIKQTFASSKAVVLVSVGQVSQEGEKLAATIELANKSFASCDVAVCDSLQRHTMQITEALSSGELYLKAKLSGEVWIQRNEEALQLLTIPHRIFRWDEYLMHHDFEELNKKTIAAYKNSPIFSKEMHATIQEFVERYEQRLGPIDRKKAFDCCFNYLAEECTIMMQMWQKCKYNYIIYPSDILRVVKASYNEFVLPVNPTLLQWLKVRVRTRSAYKQIMVEQASEN